jgi:hypothetical protein
MSGGGYSSLDDPKASGSVPVSNRSLFLLVSSRAVHLPYCPPSSRHIRAGGDGARSAGHQIHGLQPPDLPAVGRQGEDLRRLPPAHRRRRSDLAASPPVPFTFLIGSG